MKIVISGSSFLVPKNKAWQSLSNQHTLDFADYGNWSGALMKTHPQDALVLVLFLDDLIGLRNKDEGDVRSLLGTVLTLLDNRLNQAQAPLILCFATGDDGHEISNARSPNKKAVICQWFLGEVYALISQHVQLYLVDMDRLFGLRGQEVCLDARNWYLAHCRLSSLGLSILGKALLKVLHRHHAPASKILVLDCDNTIWGGVVGEDGVEGLELGQDGLGLAYVDFQAVAKDLARQGIILALASKNNEAEVWQVFDQHGDMILKRDDIVAWKINWQEKAHNIRELASELDLGLDSFVFWDDNPIERDKMRHNLPEVLTVDVNQNVFEWPRQLAGLDCFAKFSVTSDDIKKTEQYHNRARFVRDKTKVLDEIAYLKSIKLQPLAQGINPDSISRAAQLCAKTNQYNLRSVRHNQADLAALVKLNPDFCFLTSLTDMYGDHGIVGLVCMRPLDADTVFLDTLLMSCRVLGRHLETWMLRHALSIARQYSYKNIVGEFIPTKRNTVADGFLGDHGFMPLTKVDQLGSISSEVWTTIYSQSISCSSRLYVLSTQTMQLPYQEIYEKD
jgi:FkbH-like protein